MCALFVVAMESAFYRLCVRWELRNLGRGSMGLRFLVKFLLYCSCISGKFEFFFYWGRIRRDEEFCTTFARSRYGLVFVCSWFIDRSKFEETMLVEDVTYSRSFELCLSVCNKDLVPLNDIERLGYSG